MSIRLCIGSYAKNGYEPEHMGIKVYSLEELCFFIRENAYLLDQGFVDESLGKWLVSECGLLELGEELNKAARKRVSLKAFTGIILEYACFFTKEVNKEIENVIVENSSLSIYEKKKAKADALVKKGRYGLAGKEYGKLLQMLPDDMTILKGDIYHGCGVCLAKMFYFTLAGEYFFKAYALNGKTASYQQYLWAKRLSMTEAEYLDFLKEHEEAYEDSVEMEEYLEKLKIQWEHSHTGLLFAGIEKEKEMQRVADYQKKLEERVDYLKDAYREMIS